MIRIRRVSFVTALQESILWYAFQQAHPQLDRATVGETPTAFDV